MLLLGLLGIVAGVYLLLIPTSFINFPWVVLTVAISISVIGLWLSGKKLRLTVYRPIRWNLEGIMLPLLGVSVAATAGTVLQSNSTLIFILLLACAPALYVGRQS
jgi:hypothetical protein